MGVCHALALAIANANANDYLRSRNPLNVYTMAAIKPLLYARRRHLAASEAGAVAPARSPEDSGSDVSKAKPIKVKRSKSNPSKSNQSNE